MCTSELWISTKKAVRCNPVEHNGQVETENRGDHIEINRIDDIHAPIASLDAGNPCDTCGHFILFIQPPQFYFTLLEPYNTAHLNLLLHAAHKHPCHVEAIAPRYYLLH